MCVRKTERTHFKILVVVISGLWVICFLLNTFLVFANFSALNIPYIYSEQGMICMYGCVNEYTYTHTSTNILGISIFLVETWYNHNLIAGSAYHKRGRRLGEGWEVHKMFS